MEYPIPAIPVLMPCPCSRPPGRDDFAQRTLSDEHGALMRRMALLQRQVGDQMAQQSRRLSALEGDNLRLRGELVRSRTAVLWGLHTAAVTTPSRHKASPVGPPVNGPWPEAHAVICQTACVGHAHPWLDEQGHCRRTGAECQPYTHEASESGDGSGPPA